MSSMIIAEYQPRRTVDGTRASQGKRLKFSEVRTSAYDKIVLSQESNSEMRAEATDAMDEQVRSTNRTSSSNVTKSAGLGTSAVGVAYGGYSLATNSLMNRQWALVLVTFAVIIGLCFLLAKSDKRGRGKESSHA